MFATVEQYGKVVGVNFQLSGNLARRLRRLPPRFAGRKEGESCASSRLFNALRSPKRHPN